METFFRAKIDAVFKIRDETIRWDLGAEQKDAFTFSGLKIG